MFLFSFGWQRPKNSTNDVIDGCHKPRFPFFRLRLDPGCCVWFRPGVNGGNRHRHFLCRECSWRYCGRPRISLRRLIRNVALLGSTGLTLALTLFLKTNISTGDPALVSLKPLARIANTANIVTRLKISIALPRQGRLRCLNVRPQGEYTCENTEPKYNHACFQYRSFSPQTDYSKLDK